MDWTSGSGGSVENPYVTLVPKVAKDGLLVYRTKSVAMSKALLKFENKYLFKINAVYMSKSINAARYKETIQAYNRFVLYASMWRMDRPLESYKNEAIKAYNIFYKVYRRAVLPTTQNVSTQSTNPSTVNTSISWNIQEIHVKKAQTLRA